MHVDDVLSHHAAANEVFLDDALDYGRITRAVPGAVGIDHGYGTTFTDPKAVGLGAQHAALFGEPQLFQPAFQVVPRDEAPGLVTALGRRLVGTQEDMPPRDRDTDVGGNFPLG